MVNIHESETWRALSVVEMQMLILVWESNVATLEAVMKSARTIHGPEYVLDIDLQAKKFRSNIVMVRDMMEAKRMGIPPEFSVIMPGGRGIKEVLSALNEDAPDYIEPDGFRGSDGKPGANRGGLRYAAKNRDDVGERT